MPPELPLVGAIERGTVQRIEPYGAFVGLENYRLRGLIHISQLANYKVEQVEDAVSVNDIVYIKVLDIEIDPNGRPKIRLSLKDASQDGSCQDLGQERDQTKELSQQIQQNLHSSIGMGVALDPMAHLILKSVKQSKNLINGYALVDDMEGEAIIPIPVVVPSIVAPIVPMGRGRGTTLPAWMTQSDGPAPIIEDRHKRSKHSKKEKQPKRHRYDEERRKRTRTRNQTLSDNESDDSRHGRKHRHRKRRSPQSDRDDHGKEHRSRQRTSRTSRSNSNDGKREFSSVDAAKRIIAELEAKNAKHEKS
jgi:predicted RNA-binding protein with RPS1 domain